MIKNYLKERNIPYIVDDTFVRGIDYQNDTIFEIINNDKSLGTQNELCGGGRYDNLYNHLANKNLSAFGFDFGLERMITAINSQNPSYFETNSIDIYIVCFSKEDMTYCFKICDILRENGIIVEYDYLNRSYKAQLKFADKFYPKFTGFIGEDERNCGKINIRNNYDNSKQELNIQDAITMIKDYKNVEERIMVKKYVSK